MKLGAFKLALCTVIWSVLIGVGLFKLQPAVGQSRVVRRPVRVPRSKSVRRAVIKPRMPNSFLADYWATVMTDHTENPKRTKEIKKLKKELHLAQTTMKREQLADLLWDAVDDRIVHQETKNEVRYRAGRLKHREVPTGKSGIVDDLATVLAKYQKKTLREFKEE